MSDMKGRKIRWGEVTCDKHGKQMANAPWKPKQVKVPVPDKRASKYAGCPECNMG